MVNERQQLLKYTQLGADAQADAPLILARDEAACFAASEKFHALGCSNGAVYILDFQGNKIEELVKHKSRVTALAVTSTQEHVVTGSKDGHIKVQSVLGSQGGWTAHVSGAVTCIAVPPHKSDRLEEFVVGYSPGTFSLLRKSWLGASETAIHRHHSPVHATLWLPHAIVWATDVGVSACLPGGRGVAPQLHKPPQAGLRSCALAHVTADAALAAWPHAVQLFAVRHSRQRLTGLPQVRLQPLRSFTVPYRLHGIAPFGLHIAVLADVSPGACRPAPLSASTPHSRSAAAITDVDTSPQHPPLAQPEAAARVVESSDSAPTPSPEDTKSEPGDAAKDVDGTADAQHAQHSTTPSPGTPSADGDGDGGQSAGEADGGGGSVGGGPWAISADPRAAVAAMAGPQLQLRVLSLAGEELLQDDLEVDLEGDAAGADAACALACWYPPQYSHLLEPYLHSERRHSRGGGSQPPSPRAGTPDPAGSPPGSPPGAGRLRDKWWADADEPLYLVVTPAAVVEGRPCDTDDQVRWLLQQGELSAAVAAAKGAPYVRPETWQACASVYVEHLLACGDVDGAVAWVCEHLGSDGEAWERVVFTFNQRQQLPALAPHVPTARPRLGRQAYAMVAASFVPHRQARGGGGDLLPLLKGWPHGILSDVADEVSLIITRHLQTCPAAEMSDMQRALAELHSVQGNHQRALDIWLSIEAPGVFDYIEQFHLYEAAARGVAPLMAIDADRTVALLVDNADAVPAADAVAQLQAAQERAATPEEARTWRRRLYSYLHTLFVKERRATHASHDLQVELYAEFAQEQLLPFLQSSKQFHKDRALRVCRDAGLVREQVFILGRLGRASEALRLIISRLHDLPQAIAFVSSQGDSELWDELIALVVKDPALTGELLEQVGGQVDPVRLVRAIPSDLRVPRLTQRLVALMRRFRTMVQLKQHCNEIIDADCVAVATRLLQRAQEPLRYVHMWHRQAGTWELYDTLTGESAPCDAPAVPPDASHFAAPEHRHELSMRTQVAAHMSAALDALHAPGTGERRVDGMHAMLEPETQQALRQEAAAAAQMCGNGLTLWSE